MKKQEGDPWAHRRGEPRVFAFLWTLFVLTAVAGSVLWVARYAPLTGTSYGPAARIMLVVVGVGATILWPMTRLSQASPGGDRGALVNALADVMVVLVPVQMVLWPLVVLAGWPWGVVCAVAAFLCAWTVLVGGVLAVALGGAAVDRPGHPGLTGRAGWMGVLVAAVWTGPVLMLAMGAGRPGWLAMLSPLTAIPAMTGAGISGPQAPVSAVQWQAIAITAVVGLVFWVIAGARAVLNGNGGGSLINAE